MGFIANSATAYIIVPEGALLIPVALGGHGLCLGAGRTRSEENARNAAESHTSGACLLGAVLLNGFYIANFLPKLINLQRLCRQVPLKHYSIVLN